MGKCACLFSSTLFLGLALPNSAFCTNNAQTPDPQQTQPSSTVSTQKPARKLHVKKGSKNDINAIGKRNLVSSLDWYSLDKEITIGKRDASEVEKRYKLLDDPSINQYIERLGQKLVSNSDAKVPFTIKVVDSDEIRAFSLPGGFLYVNSGLISGCDNEGELAGVMAHAIAHVAARHAVRLLTDQAFANLVSTPLIRATQSDFLGLNTPVVLLKFHRYFEAEADYLGIQYLYKAGYDPMTFVARMERNYKNNPVKPGSLGAAFASEPLPVERLAAAKKEIAEILPPANNLVVDTPEFETVKARVVALKALPRQDDQPPK